MEATESAAPFWPEREREGALKLTLVGHACIFVEAAGLSILMDPNLQSTFREGRFTFSPNRVVHLDRLPKPDAILISHRHRDHFDLASLVHFDRRTPIIYPQDSLMTYALKRLGFRDLASAGSWEEITLNERISIVTTASCFDDPASDYQEHGFLLLSENGMIWNLADTIITPEIIAAVSQLSRPLDLVFYPFQPGRQTEVITNRPTQFPYQEYSQRLQHLNYIRPKALVPSSSGYRVRGSNEWINHFKFPVTREQFVADVASLRPEIQVFNLNPGDCLHQRDGQFTLEKQGATNNFVEMLEDDTAAYLHFNPVGEMAPITDDNQRHYDLEHLRQEIHKTFLDWANYINKDLGRWAVWTQWELVYRFRIIYSDGEETLILAFSRDGVTLVEATDKRIDFYMDCSASCLYGLVTGEAHFDYQLAGEIRTFNCMYRTSPYGAHPLEELIPEYSEELLDAFGIVRRLINHDGKSPYRVVDTEIARLLN
jgi:UDP-MurNAc hydroxylase